MNQVHGLSPAADISQKTGYRPDIDGLRAIAVLAVITFHAGVAHVAGGFVGVDVFFVISGYLIGGQIFRQMRRGVFSYIDFYARRARRILPALYFLLAVLLLLGVAVMTPLELRDLAKETVAAVLAASNILFYTGGGYFAPNANFNPLLMTWTLGLEEQFYIVFPVLLFFLFKFRRVPPITVVGVLSLLSFIGSLALTHSDQQAAFYLLPTRAWELGLGTVIALWEQDNPVLPSRRSVVDFAALAAPLLLLAAIVIYRPAFDFPGVYALIPTLTAAILISTRTSWVNQKLLSSPLLVFVGRVSYSWYLWHWPLIYFNRILYEDGKGLPPAALVILSFVLAVISWRFVEQPFRRRPGGNGATLLLYAFLGVAILVPALMLYRADGWAARFSPAVQVFSESSRLTRENPCLAPYEATAPQQPARCLPVQGRDRILLMGDSHASALSIAFRAVAGRQGLGFGEITKSSCPPLWNIAPEAPQHPGRFAGCAAFQRNAFAYVAAHPDIKTVVLAGYWPSDTALMDAAVPAAERREIPLLTALDRTVAELRKLGRKVILVQDVPTLRFDPYARVVGDMIPARRVLSGLLGANRGQDSVAAYAEVIADPVRPVLAAVVKLHPDVTLLDPMASLCDRSGCHYRGPDGLYYSDYQHLTSSGAERVVGGLR